MGLNTLNVLPRLDCSEVGWLAGLPQDRAPHHRLFNC